MYKMPIGIEDFREMREDGYYFVDKTKLIQQILDGHHKVTLFARPRRFGKTLTLSMVDYFFNIAYKDVAPRLFAGTWIAQAGQEYGGQMSSRPAIFLTLKDIKEETFEGFCRRIGRLMAVLYLKYHFLTENDTLHQAEIAYYDRIEQEHGTESDLQDALRSLMDFLVRYYGKPVILLLDEYDAPIQYAWERGYYDRAIAFMRNFFSAALKTNPSLDFALLTGVLRIAKESIFSGLNNLSVSTVVAGGYADVFGFTKMDVQQMAKELQREDALSELEQWYDGYDFQGVDIYNPWSVINYFSHQCIAAPYWVNSSHNTILDMLTSAIDEERFQDLQGLMEGKSVIAYIDENIVYGDIEEDRDVLYNILLLTGYLKTVGVYDAYNGLYELAIPNKEVRSVYRHEILTKFGRGIKDRALRGMLQAMTAGDARIFQKHLQDILLRLVSIRDTGNPEAFYHGLMLGLALYYEQGYCVESNQESGYGFFDLAMIPKKKTLPGIIMEFKAVKKTDDLETAAQRGRQQIEDKAYMTALRDAGITKIWAYGIAFCGKHVKIVVKGE